MEASTFVAEIGLRHKSMNIKEDSKRKSNRGRGKNLSAGIAKCAPAYPAWAVIRRSTKSLGGGRGKQTKIEGGPEPG